MGVVVSSPTTTSPFFLTTGIIGLVSFAFTVSTFLKVVWTNLETMGEAPHEVHGYLTNLRQELLEERASVRAMRRFNRNFKKRAARRRRRDGGDGAVSEPEPINEVTLKVMGDTVKTLIRRFREIEKPFLEPGERGIDDDLHHRSHTGAGGKGGGSGGRQHHHRRPSRHRDSSASPYYSHEAYASPREKSWDPERGQSRGRGGGGRDSGDPYREEDDEHDDDDDQFWAQRTEYADYGLRKRLKWLITKPDAQQLVQALTRVQIRRMAQQVGGLTRLHHQYGQYTLDMEDMIRRIDDRMNRFVGVRRIDGGSNA